MATGSIAPVYSGMVARALQDGVMVAADGAVAMLKDHAPIASDEQATLVVGLAGACRDGRLQLKRQVDTILDPLKEATKAVNSLSKPKLEQYEAGELRGKELVGTWNRKKEAAAAAAAAAAQAAEQSDGIPDDDAPPDAVVHAAPPPMIVRAGNATMHETTITKVRVTDKAAAMAAAPELWELEEANAKRQLQGGRVIPGLELYTEKSQVMR